MSEKPISPLRRRMLQDMAVRRLGEKAQSNYIRQIETFTLFLGRSPTRRRQKTCAAFRFT